ncbi:hypothetical protein ES703_96338 [subsurface metagenome]
MRTNVLRYIVPVVVSVVDRAGIMGYGGGGGKV